MNLNLPTVTQLPCGSENDESPPKTPIRARTSEYKRIDSEVASTTASASPTTAHFEESGFIIGFCEDKNRMHRRTMEDTHVMKAKFADKLGQGFFAVFDGHAGKQAAQWCGDHVHELLEELLDLRPDAPIPDLLNEAFVSADNKLADLQIYSGCTVVVCFVQVLDHGRVLHTANVGDARAVLCRGGKAIRLTYDHKGSDANEAKRIVDAGGLVLNDRVNGVLAVTRSLGDCSMKALVVGNPYTTSLDLTCYDEFLILACDGVWDVLSDQEAVELVRHIDDPQVAAKTLVYKSLENMSTDNLSVIVIRFLHDSYLPRKIEVNSTDDALENEEDEDDDGEETPTPSSVSLSLAHQGG